MVTTLVKMLELLFTLADPGAGGERKRRRKRNFGSRLVFVCLVGWIPVCLFLFLKKQTGEMSKTEPSSIWAFLCIHSIVPS